LQGSGLGEHQKIGNLYLFPSIQSSPMISEVSPGAKGSQGASAKET